jgi:hypothetical protein
MSVILPEWPEKTFFGSGTGPLVSESNRSGTKYILTVESSLPVKRSESSEDKMSLVIAPK